MPLFADGLRKIRQNLSRVQAGERPKPVRIGAFTAEQLSFINRHRLEDELEPIDGVIVFVGKHLYNSRCVKDGYTIDEIIEQIESAFAATSEVECERNTVLASTVIREDSNGQEIIDEAVFECTQKFPHAELWSVIPNGDGRHPTKKRLGPSTRSLINR